MTRRSYRQNCPLARALDAVGERWTLLIIRELLLGPLRYGEIQERLPGIGTNLLADRLKHLERLGLVQRVPDDPGHHWTLTEAGRGLEPSLMAMIRWAMKTRLPSRPADSGRPEWDLVAMKALFRPDPSGETDGRYQLVLNGLRAALTVTAGRLTAEAGAAGTADAVVEMDSATGWMLATRSLSPDQALESGRLRIAGDRTRCLRLLERFRAP